MKISACICLLWAACAANGAEWEDLTVNSLGRLPARTYSMPLADEKAALTDDLEPETPFKKSLNGNWKFSWAGSPDLRAKDFWKEGYDDGDWFEIDVPSCAETRGFGTPGYTNTRYPHAWDPKRDIAAPTIRDRQSDKANYNPVLSYRTRFTVPDAWKGRDVILRFDGVYSAYYVWVNGHKVGYAEDSKLPSEFDITPYLNLSTPQRPQPLNLLCVEVYRWSDGSFLEDQDMFRFSGIFRDVTLWAKPKDGIWDFAVRTARGKGEAGKDQGEKWSLEIEGIDGEWTATLYDAVFKPMANLSNLSNVSNLSDISPWSAEKPYLYTLVLKKGADIRMKRIGFKEQKIVGHTVLVNGRKIKFKGVNRHETSPENGRTVSMDEMVRDITLFKRYNIDTVRTCHYPDHHLWYDLCDRYGIYVVAEANVEGHEPGYGEQGLGRFPQWDHAIVERNARHVTFYRNNPCVTLWSLGNETGHGDCFRHATAAVKKLDATRPVHWERGNVDADIDSSMYPTVEWLETRGRLGDGLIDTYRHEGTEDTRHTKGKAFFLCEYAHAMGNAIGNFREYWDVFYRYDSLSGGCIWDWVDQGLWKQTGRIDPKSGKAERFYAYGGDWDEEPNDGPFCCNGVVGPDRAVSAKLIEVGHVHRNLVVKRLPTEGAARPAVALELWNRFGFTAADEFAGKWHLREDGARTASGEFEVPSLGPLSKCRFEIPDVAAALARAKPGAELLLDVEFETKTDSLWAPKGWIVARDQLELGEHWRFVSADGLRTAAPRDLRRAEDRRTVTVECGGTKAVFCRKSGTLCELTMGGKRILGDAASGLASGPRLACLRAFTDNDKWIRRPFYASGLAQLSYHARPFQWKDGALRIVTEVTGSKSAGFTHEALWRFSSDGSLFVSNAVTPHGAMPEALPRIGLELRLDGSLENVSYYGRGPLENYVDRNSGSFLGLWRSTVAEQAEPYVRPQDNGSKTDVRWVSFSDADGRGVRFSASEPLFMQALHQDAADLERARHRRGQEAFRVPLVQTEQTVLHLDVRQLGLGGGSCGPRPMDKYVFPVGPVSWSLKIEPTAQADASPCADLSPARVDL